MKLMFILPFLLATSTFAQTSLRISEYSEMGKGCDLYVANFGNSGQLWIQVQATPRRVGIRTVNP